MTRFPHGPNSCAGTTCLLNSVHSIVGRVFFGGALALPEHIPFKLAAIRHERYYEVSIETDYQGSHSPCTMLVEDHQNKFMVQLPLPSKILLHAADNYNSFNNIAELCMCVCMTLCFFIKIFTHAFTHACSHASTHTHTHTHTQCTFYIVHTLSTYNLHKFYNILVDHQTTIYKITFKQEIFITCDNEHAILFKIPSE